ncbi:MAG: MarR family winged helix-turn-helix transcriptional regulator [Candidatus Hodarchaeota archaeon]
MGVKQGGFLITKIHHLSGRIFSRKLKEYEIEISPGQGRILFSLWQQDKVPIKSLVKNTQLGKSTLTEMLDRLEKDGLLIRRSSKDDRREILIELTEKAKKTHERYDAVSKEMSNLFYRGFSEREIEELEKYLDRLLENLVEYDTRQASNPF